ncbi:UDP-3-O-acyl-N-acetylglucosamine deacetylase [Burkholderia pseudomallei]|uniref:UDP-3-O-acyl-N-acetylglucosamine deacetylase n=1 Tax=Burkholderia pseudomallei TaxID=28450 RepID=UPI003F68802F
MPDEFVRHRVLALVGDLALAGSPLLARVSSVRPSHEMTFRLVDALLAATGARQVADFSQS